jgi:hypothetical protein
LAKAQTAAVQAAAVVGKAASTSKAAVRGKAAPKAPKAPSAFKEKLSAEEKGTKGIAEAELRRYCPAVFATTPNRDKVSDNYCFVNTWELVKPLLEEGFVVTSVQQKRPQDNAKAQASMLHTRHLVRLRQSAAPMLLGEAFPELVVVNGHAGQTKFSMYEGLFRLICLNGMITGSQTSGIVTKHTGELSAIMEEAQRVIKSAQEKARTIEAWLAHDMNKSARFDFAKHAMALAYGDENAFDPALLLAPRRDIDRATDLWHVFNVVQENVMRGGIEYKTANQRHTYTRGFSNVPRTVEFNASLWESAEALAGATA